MKKEGKRLRLWPALLMAAVCGLCSCTDPKIDREVLPEVRDFLCYTRFDPDAYLTPVWNAREVYQETLLFLGKEDEKQLLFQPDTVVSVRNYGLDREYAEGEDYVLTDDGRLRLTEESAIPYFELEDFYPTRPTDPRVDVKPGHLPEGLEGERYIWLGSDRVITARQVCVTYRHSVPYEGFVQESQAAKVASFVRKLRSGEGGATVMFYGDSITWGGDASGNEQLGDGKYPPYMPNWATLVKDFLAEKFACEMTYLNQAVGGYSVEQGLDDYTRLVTPHPSDLLVLAFGMNDAGRTPLDFFNKTREMVDMYLEENPEACVLLVSPMLANPDSTWLGNQPDFEAQLERLAMAYTNVGLVKMTSMHKSLLERKTYQDMTSNNVNHPNDFLGRMYAQTVLRAVLGDEYDMHWERKAGL